MKRLALVLALFATGCAIGGGSSVVGRWRARRVIDSTVCVQNEAPQAACDKVVAVGRDLPARSFAGALFAFASPGYVQQRGNGEVGHGFALDSHLEYFRGRGRFAIAARLGGDIRTGFGKRMYFLMPLSIVGHVGGLWGSVYVGAGYAPIAMTRGGVDDEMPPPWDYHFDSVQAFVGTRFWLTRTLERGLSLSPELRIQTLDGMTLTSATFNIGVHL